MGRKIIANALLDAPGHFNPMNLVNPFTFGGGGPPFSPTDIAGLQLWLKADSLVLSDGDPVGTWTDSSGNSNDATASGGSRPTYKTNILNGLPVVRFSGSNLLVSPLVLNQPMTVLVVLTTTSTSGRWLESAGFSTASRIIGDTYFAGNLLIYAGSLVTGSSWGGTHYAAWVFDGASSSIYKDGTQVVTGNPGSAAITIHTLFGADSALSTGFNGDMPEVIIYNSNLSPTDLSNCSNYLKSRYGL